MGIMVKLFVCLLVMVSLYTLGATESCSSFCRRVQTRETDTSTCTKTARRRSGWWWRRRTVTVTVNDCCSGFVMRYNRCIRLTNVGPPCGCNSLVAALTDLQQTFNNDTFVGPPCTTEPADNPNGMSDFNAVTDSSKKWPSGIIPYRISGFGTSDRNKILQGISTLNAQTCLRLVPRTTHRDYVDVTNTAGCWSYVGRRRGRQQLSLQASGCLRNGIVMHEFLHAAGFYHEQTRPDRNNHVCVNYQNIQSRGVRNFYVVPSSTLSTAYTLRSIMHYRPFDFAINRRIPTIFPKSCSRSDLLAMGWTDNLNSVDIDRVKRLYRC